MIVLAIQRELFLVKLIRALPGLNGPIGVNVRGLVEKVSKPDHEAASKTLFISTQITAGAYHLEPRRKKNDFVHSSLVDSRSGKIKQNVLLLVVVDSRNKQDVAKLGLWIALVKTAE